MDYRRPVKFGYFIIPDATQPLRALEQAIKADEAGIDLIGIQDHPYQHRFHDTWTLLSVIAARTSRVTVFPDVANLPLRPPAMLAKAAASLDLLSNGRVELGLGAGGFWEAIKAMGGPARTACACHRHLARRVQAEDARAHRPRRRWVGAVLGLPEASGHG